MTEKTKKLPRLIRFYTFFIPFNHSVFLLLFIHKSNFSYIHFLLAILISLIVQIGVQVIHNNEYVIDEEDQALRKPFYIAFTWFMMPLIVLKSFSKRKDYEKRQKEKMIEELMLS